MVEKLPDIGVTGINFRGLFVIALGFRGWVYFFGGHDAVGEFVEVSALP